MKDSIPDYKRSTSVELYHMFTRDVTVRTNNMAFLEEIVMNPMLGSMPNTFLKYIMTVEDNPRLTGKVVSLEFPMALLRDLTLTARLSLNITRKKKR